MGLFSFFSRVPKPTVNIDCEISCVYRTVEISDEDMEKFRSGWKRDVNGVIHEPDTVWSVHRSKVYHNLDCCCGCVIGSNIHSMPEDEAISRGLRRCARCDWEHSQYENSEVN